MEAKSLKLTKKVLNKRKKIQVSIENIKNKIIEGILKLDDIRKDCEAIEKFERQIKNNKNFPNTETRYRSKNRKCTKWKICYKQQ